MTGGEGNTDVHTCRENWRVMHLYLHADVVTPTTFTLHSGKVRALKRFSAIWGL